MAIFLPDQNAMFIHIPKTGGQWVEEALLRTGVPVQLITHPQDPRHADRHCLFEHTELKPNIVFACVRDPAEWYESWWKYQTGREHSWDEWEWHPTYPLQNCRHSEFNEFMEIVINIFPGFVSKLYDCYLRTEDMLSRHVVVCRTDKLADHFLRVMTMLGIKCSDSATRKFQPINRSHGTCGNPIWRKDVKARMYKAESEIMERYFTCEDYIYL